MYSEDGKRTDVEDKVFVNLASNSSENPRWSCWCKI